MPFVERIEAWRGEDVLDAGGEKIGRLEEVYYDPSTQQPVLLSVKSGILGRQLALVPAERATVSRNYVRVPYTGEQVGHSQGFRAEDELTGEQVAAVGAVFGLGWPVDGPLHSASLIERQLIEAEEARRRAEELELDAGRRHEQAHDARRRAAAASEEAQAAERERDQAQAEAEEARRRAEAANEQPSKD